MSLDSWYPPERKRPPIEREGIRVDAPAGWEARIRRRDNPERDGETHPVLHAATVPLRSERADYGGGVVELLSSQDVFVSLVEFGPEQVGTALFAEVDELPTLAVEMFHRDQLQRRIRGQGGVQRFFSYRGRAFCLYAVLGSMGGARQLVPKVNELLKQVSIETR